MRTTTNHRVLGLLLALVPGAAAMAACPAGQVEGIDGLCYPDTWIGDNVCDPGLNAAWYGFDGGDCRPGAAAGTGDFNGDGFPDVLRYDPATRLMHVWNMLYKWALADSGPVEYGGAPWPLPAGLEIVSVADFDGDGRDDVLLLHPPTGSLAILYLNGRVLIGGDYIRNAAGVTLVVNPNMALSAVDDFDGDGRADILMSHKVTGASSVWYMNGLVLRGDSGPVFSWTGRRLRIPPHVEVLGTGDGNGDGTADLMLRNTKTQTTHINFMLPGRITHPMSGPILKPDGVGARVNRRWSVVAVGDFNGDGLVDIMWHHATARKVVIWFMNWGFRTSASGQVLDETTGQPVLMHPRWVGSGRAADFDLDGVADVLWRHGTSNRDVLWLLNGRTRRADSGRIPAPW